MKLKTTIEFFKDLQAHIREMEYSDADEAFVLNSLSEGYFADAIEALKKAEKYRWHDLRKDPKDLPEDDRKVECITLTKSGKSNHMFGYFGRRWVCGMCSNVIAWREIEPFEEDEA